MKRPTAIAALVALAAAGASALGADNPYRKQATWFDALLHYRAAAAAQAEATEPVPLPDFGQGKFTVAAWVRTRHDGSILAKTRAKGAWANGGKALFVRGRVVCYDIGWVGCVTGKTRVADGAWHHVALVGGRPQHIYVDGKLDAKGGLEARPDPAGSALKIGHTSDNFPHGGRGFDGDIDDVRLYSRVLSEKEIQTVASTPSAKIRGLLGHWPFDGDTLDASGGNNHPAAVKTHRFVAGKAGKALSLKDAAHLVVAPSGADGPLNALWSRLAADFPEARQEMAWERADGVWGADFTRARLGDIARVYAASPLRPTSLGDQAKALAAKATTVADLKAVRELYLKSKRYDLLLERIASFDLKGLRATVHDLYGGTPQGKGFLTQLDALEAQAVKWGAGDIPAGELDAWKKKLASLRREVLIAHNPLFTFDKLVFVKRFTYTANHYYTEFINSRWTPGGNLCMLDLKTGEVTELVPELEGGVFERFDIRFDARRIVFAWKAEAQKGYRLYEIGIDPETGKRQGTLRQLTFPQENEAWLVKMYRARAHYHHGTDDMHPCYLPDGDIAFISTRCQYGILCDAPDDFTTTVLYRMDPDGKEMTKLSNSSVSEASPVVLPDGRILYTRWEYLDKGAVSVKCLWAMNPDGSASSEIYANDISLPPTFLYGRPIPGADGHYVVLGTPHYPQNGVGTVIRLNLGGGNIRTREPMTYMTPYTDIQAEGGFSFRDGNSPWRRDRGGNGPLFKDPYPLSKKYYLVSHKPAGTDWRDAKGYGLYLLDETGKVSLIYRDPEISCWLPYPLQARPVPPVLATSRDPKLAAGGLARCIVADVYHGLSGVERGTIRYIRILEQVPRPWATRRRWPGDTYDQQHACVSKDTHLGLKVQHGVVPVEPDGSAHFLVPAGGNIAFQALDEHYMAVQTERTYVNYMPGEVRSCVGCHETLEDAPPPTASPAALVRPPSMPGPQPGETRGQRPLHYPTDVQPVLDKHCVRCHSGKEPKAKLNLSGQLTDLFCVSYEQLVPERRRRSRGDRGLLGPVIGENHPKTGNVHYLPPRSLGSHASVLVAMLAPDKVTLADPRAAARAARLAEQHKDIRLKLAPEELLRITNWVDTNAQYYGAYWGRRHLQHKAHPNFRPTPTYATALSMTSPIPEEQR